MALSPREREANVEAVQAAARELKQVENYLADIQARAAGMQRLVTECRETIDNVMRTAQAQKKG